MFARFFLWVDPTVSEGVLGASEGLERAKGLVRCLVVALGFESPTWSLSMGPETWLDP